MATPQPKVNKIGIGAPGERLIDTYSNEELRLDDLRIQDYRKMVDSDGQIQMIYNAITSTIHSVGFTIEDDPDIEAEESSKEKKFITQVLTSPVYKDGMVTPIEDVNRSMLRAFVEGYRVFEIVYKQVGDQIQIERVAPRAAMDDAGMKLVVDKKGHFLGFHQVTNLGSKRIDVTVKNTSDILKVVKSTYGEEFGSLYGRSGLRAAWYHYDKVHKAMYLEHKGLEHGAEKLRHAKTKGNMTEEKTDEIVAMLSKMQQGSVVAMPDNEAELVLEDLSDAQVMAVGKDMIDLHYSLMAKSVLAQFVDLGSTTSNTGSRSLGESQVDFFKEGLQGLAEILIEKPWNQIIASLIKANFDNGIYPTLKVNKINDDSSDLLHEALLELTKKGNVPDSVKTQMIAKGGESLGLEVDEEELMTEIEEQTQKDQEREDNQAEMLSQSKKDIAQANLSENKDTHIHLQDDGTQRDLVESKLDDTPMARPLFPDEEKVKWVDIKRKMDDAQSRARVTLSQKLSRQKDDIIQSFIEASRQGRSALRKQKVELQEIENTYSEELLAIAFEMLEFGKINGANELDSVEGVNASIPNTTKKIRQGVIDRVNLVIDEQESRLQFRLQNVANDSLDSDVSEDETVLLLEEEYDSFFDTVLAPTLGAIIPGMFNKGLDIISDFFKSNIWGFRYSAILDGSTTNFCRSLDGRIFQITSPDYHLLKPPNHFRCRSRPSYITFKEQEKYNFSVDGKPNSLPVFSSIDTFKDPISVALSQKESRLHTLIESLDENDMNENNIVKLIDSLDAESTKN